MSDFSYNNVLILDDQKIITDLLQSNLKAEKIAKNIDTCDSFNDARYLINSKNYCFAIVDIQLGLNKKQGFEIANFLSKKSPKTNILFTSFLTDSSDVVNFIESNYSSMVCKSDGYNELIAAIKSISLGHKSYLSPKVQKLINEYNSKIKQYNSSNPYENLLTKREIQIIIQISKGKPYKIIADAFCLKISTVKKHVQNIYKKLGLNNKVEIIKYAIDNQFVNL